MGECAELTIAAQIDLHGLRSADYGTAAYKTGTEEQNMDTGKKHIVVGASGASGMPVLLECLRILRQEDVYTTLILSEGAVLTLKQETDSVRSDIETLADQVFSPEEIGAPTASGSYRTDGMLIVPCSMKTLAGIHSGYAENLLLRSADVTMKEGRPLVLGVRETPFNAIHLRNMQELSLINGVRIVPLMMSFYHRPESIEDMVHHMAAKLLEGFGIEAEGYHRWQGLTPGQKEEKR